MKHPVLWFFRILSIAFLALNIYLEHSGQFVIEPTQKIILAGIFIFLVTCSVVPFGSSRRYHIWLWLLFFYYIWVLINILFLDIGFGRDHIMTGVNLHPFHTIRNYLRAYELGNISQALMRMNLIGNLAAFMPMAFFLPALFRWQGNLLIFLLTILCMVASVEAVQYVTHTGSCDIDDLILNTAGAVGVWLILLPMRLILRYRERAK